MKKQLLILIVFCAAYFVSPLLWAEDDKFDYKPHHFQLGYAPTAIFTTFSTEDSDDSLSTFVHGVHLSYDWRSRGLLGVQVPVNYYFTNDFGSGVFEYGVNLMVHFIKNQKRFDPYATVGVHGYVFPGVSDVPIFATLPLVPNVGLGARYSITPNFGVFGEVNASSLLIVNQVTGKAGVVVAF